jgi:hypothetical protein
MYEKILCMKTIYIEIQMKHIDGKEFMKIQTYHMGGKKTYAWAKTINDHMYGNFLNIVIGKK